MAFWSNWFKKKEQKTQVSDPIKPETYSVRSTDYTNKAGESVGGITTTQKGSWSGRRGRRSSGGSSSRVIQSDFPEEQTQEIVESRGQTVEKAPPKPIRLTAKKETTPTPTAILSPREAGTFKSDLRRDTDVAFYTPQFGTTQRGKTGYTTYGDLQEEVVLKRMGETKRIREGAQAEIENYYGGLQMDIDQGKISLEDAEKSGQQFIELKDKETQPEIDKIYEKYPDIVEASQYKDLRSTGTKIKEDYIPVYSSGLQAKEAGIKMSEEYTKFSGAESLGIQPNQKQFLSSTGMFGLKSGLFLADVTLVGETLKAGQTAGKQFFSKELAKETSKGVERLGTSRITMGSVIDTGSGKFAQRFTQSTKGFSRSGVVVGEMQKGRGGFNFVPQGTGFSIAQGKAELTGVKKIGAKVLGSPTKQYFIQPQTFEVGAGSVGKVGGKSFGFETGRQMGFGTFSPVKTSQATFTRKEEALVQLENNVIFGGQTTMETSFVPTFTKRTSQGAATYFETPSIKGVQIAKARSKGVTPVEILDTPKTSRTPFEMVETPTTKVTRTKTTRTSTILERPQAKTENTQLTQTLQKGFSKNQLQYKPFTFRRKTNYKPFLGLTTSRTISSTTTTPKVTSQFKGTLTANSQLTGQALKPSQKQLTGQGLKSSGVSSPIITPVTSAPIVPPPIAGVGGFMGGWIPPLQMNLPKPKGAKTLGFERAFQYAPSYKAMVYGIEGAKTEGIKVGGRELYTGFETRKIVKKKTTKKKVVKRKTKKK